MAARPSGSSRLRRRRVPHGSWNRHGRVGLLGFERRAGVHRGESRGALPGSIRRRRPGRNARQRAALGGRPRGRHRRARPARPRGSLLPRRLPRRTGGRVPPRGARPPELADGVLERARDLRGARVSAPASHGHLGRAAADALARGGRDSGLGRRNVGDLLARRIRHRDRRRRRLRAPHSAPSRRSVRSRRRARRSRSDGRRIRLPRRALQRSVRGRGGRTGPKRRGDHAARLCGGRRRVGARHALAGRPGRGQARHRADRGARARRPARRRNRRVASGPPVRHVQRDAGSGRGRRGRQRRRFRPCAPDERERQRALAVLDGRDRRVGDEADRGPRRRVRTRPGGRKRASSSTSCATRIRSTSRRSANSASSASSSWPARWEPGSSQGRADCGAPPGTSAS